MRILLLGEYSNVHATLAEGLRALGHEVTVASDGDAWKNYRRDIDLKRRSTGLADSMRFLWRLERTIPRLKEYDIVQIINPVFLDIKAERIYRYYRMLRRNNRKMVLGAFGMDHYWVKAGLDCTTFRYSDFNIGHEVRHSEDNDTWIRDWLKGGKGRLNRMVAADCDAIVSGLYEYDASYRPYFADKLRFIPFPINPDATTAALPHQGGKIRFFIGIQRSRSAYKGTDIMLRALQRVCRERPEQCEMVKVESVPFEQYERLMNSSDVILDQLYSYTPAMNALLGMAKGLIVVGGAEPENYEILGDTDLHPIINVEPDEESVYQALLWLADHPEKVPLLRSQSREYVMRYHHYLKVARQYIELYNQLLE
jgi:glycosyltransferase involved in cell wall biosynthesis